MDSQVAQNPEQSRSQVVRPNEQVIHLNLLQCLWFWSSNIAIASGAVIIKVYQLFGMTPSLPPLWLARLVDPDPDPKVFFEPFPDHPIFTWTYFCLGIHPTTIKFKGIYMYVDEKNQLIKKSFGRT